MKLFSVFCLGIIAGGFAQMAQAAAPVPSKALGIVDATVAGCSKVDPNSAEAYRQLARPGNSRYD